MNYTGYNFVFDGVPSEKYDVFLCRKENNAGNRTDDIGSNIKYHTAKTSGMDYNYMVGMEYEDTYEFPLTFGSEHPKDEFDISVLSKWLIGHKEYKRLQILQDDLGFIYFNCYIKKFKVTTFGNLPFAFECTVVCDRGWALEKERTYNYNITQNPQTIIHNNISHKNSLTAPKIIITSNKANGEVSIKNVTNNNWETCLTGLLKDEVITMDSDTEIIESSSGLLTLGRFNKHYFELVPNQNKIIVTGDISNLKIIYSNARVVG